tara:strand:+ start:36 stop:464 length:429 start_codon:yes stop_codon:yes gene_type:complete
VAQVNEQSFLFYDSTVLSRGMRWKGQMRMIQLLGVVGSLAQTFLEGKVEKEKAKSEIMKTAAQHDSKWEMIMAESTKGSWKDEVITIAVLTPCILSFIPGMEDIVKSGFERLSELPDWYQNILYVTILAGLGLKGLDKFRRK